MLAMKTFETNVNDILKAKHGNKGRVANLKRHFECLKVLLAVALDCHDMLDVEEALDITRAFADQMEMLRKSQEQHAPGEVSKDAGSNSKCLGGAGSPGRSPQGATQTQTQPQQLAIKNEEAVQPVTPIATSVVAGCVFDVSDSEDEQDKSLGLGGETRGAELTKAAAAAAKVPETTAPAPAPVTPEAATAPIVIDEAGVAVAEMRLQMQQKLRNAGAAQPFTAATPSPSVSCPAHSTPRNMAILDDDQDDDDDDDDDGGKADEEAADKGEDHVAFCVLDG